MGTPSLASVQIKRAHCSPIWPWRQISQFPGPSWRPCSGGDYPDVQARKSLRNTLANLRQLFNPPNLSNGSTSPLLIDRQVVQLQTNEQTCIVDVVSFDALLATAQNDVPESQQQLLAQAAALYQGDLLTGLPAIDALAFEEWRVLQQEARHRQVMDALNTLTAHAMDHGDYERAQSYAHRQIALEPWQERAHRQLMQLLATVGNRSAALAQFEACRQMLDAELSVAPSAETVALYEQIRDGAWGVRSTGVESTGVEHNGEGISTLAQNEDALSPTPHAPYPLLPDQKLFGIDDAKTELLQVLTPADRPWLVAIDGLGGIGKTTLASNVMHAFVVQAARPSISGGKGQRAGALAQRRWQGFGWVSAKQEEFRPAAGLAVTGHPALDAAELTDALLDQLLERPPLASPTTEKQATLTNLLKAQPYLVVVDNLESMVDYESLLPFLRQLANPTKFIITSRLSLRSEADVYTRSLNELSQEDAVAFLRHEAEVQGIGPLRAASPEQLARIYAVVGGNPLALKMVLGQVSYLPLALVLTNLQEAQGKRVDELYTYIYWQAWQMMSESCRQLFVVLPLAHNGTFADLLLASQLGMDDVQEGLQQLMALSLVQVGGTLDEPRYQLHRLTETFLMNEVLKWGTPN